MPIGKSIIFLQKMKNLEVTFIIILEIESLRNKSVSGMQDLYLGKSKISLKDAKEDQDKWRYSVYELRDSNRKDAIFLQTFQQVLLTGNLTN